MKYGSTGKKSDGVIYAAEVKVFKVEKGAKSEEDIERNEMP